MILILVLFLRKDVLVNKIVVKHFLIQTFQVYQKGPAPLSPSTNLLVSSEGFEMVVLDSQTGEVVHQKLIGGGGHLGTTLNTQVTCKRLRRTFWGIENLASMLHTWVVLAMFGQIQFTSIIY